MADKIFWENPYQTHLETEIASVSDELVTLKETIFYAFSGGQESDSGTIGGFPVADARKNGNAIFYTLPQNHGLIPGDPVIVEIDWERRYKLMRLHFAAEIVLELIYRRLAGSKKIGAHISAKRARIDFKWNESISPILPEISNAAQKLVDADATITSDFSDRENEKRFWEIQGFARIPCGGTHLKRTGEVGTIKLKRKNIGKNKERVNISLV